MSIEEDSSEELGQSKRDRIRSNVGQEGYIQIKNLTKTFNDGEVIAVKDVNLEVSSSEFVVLLGPSGCGKTTTLRCLAGLEVPDSGRIFIGEDDITDKKPKDRNLAFVFQNIALLPHKTVRENMRFGLDMATDYESDEKEEKVNNAAQILGIEAMLDRKPAALSGGQQQRVALGRAMVMEPAAFLLDEPFSALDANLRDKMRVEIKKLQRTLETAMVFVTHDQEEAMTVGDKIVVMNEAEVQQIGSPYEIYNDPKNEFVASFIGSPSTNFFDCELKQDNDQHILKNGQMFELPLPTETAGDFTNRIGDSFILGIRPEHIVIDAEDPLFKPEMTVVEPKGSEDAVYLQSGEEEIRVTTGQNAVSEEREVVPIDFNRKKLWVFERNGRRVI